MKWLVLWLPLIICCMWAMAFERQVYRLHVESDDTGWQSPPKSYTNQNPYKPAPLSYHPIIIPQKPPVRRPLMITRLAPQPAISRPPPRPSSHPNYAPPPITAQGSISVNTSTINMNRPRGSAESNIPGLNTESKTGQGPIGTLEDVKQAPSTSGEVLIVSQSSQSDGKNEHVAQASVVSPNQTTSSQQSSPNPPVYHPPTRLAPPHSNPPTNRPPPYPNPSIPVPWMVPSTYPSQSAPQIRPPMWQPPQFPRQYIPGPATNPFLQPSHYVPLPGSTLRPPPPNSNLPVNRPSQYAVPSVPGHGMNPYPYLNPPSVPGHGMNPYPYLNPSVPGPPQYPKHSVPGPAIPLPPMFQAPPFPNHSVPGHGMTPFKYPNQYAPGPVPGPPMRQAPAYSNPPINGPLQYPNPYAYPTISAHVPRPPVRQAPPYPNPSVPGYGMNQSPYPHNLRPHPPINGPYTGPSYSGYPHIAKQSVSRKTTFEVKHVYEENHQHEY
ncbi:blast:Tetra-peptide repeat homeobox protein 1 [Drosophila guanche]|uniref:Blast:Tetra-peptide repeat homeobox protein 1 n=1 Tax=Drosophila guanche TaxID=7266 RepID=A0A3B0JVR6_DROGU|nr:blast:Tetra-peptide repeat homeobox protein 1 [Drosophila guanche]